MKKIRYIIGSVLLLAGMLYTVPSVLFQIPRFQKAISHTVAKYLEDRTGTPINIGKIDFQPFNKLILKDIYLEDRSGDTVFVAKRISVGFDFLPLFRQQFHIQSAHIYTFTFNLTRESADAPLNIQYIIDAFRQKENKPTNIDVNIQNLSLKRGNFSYRVKDIKPTPGRFNPNDIYLKEITSTVQLHELTDTLLTANIERLKCTEKSGFQIKQLACDLAINDSHARVNRLDIMLPSSHIQLAEIVASYSPDGQKNIFTDKTHFNLQIKPSQIHPKDICPFIPSFSFFQNQLEIAGKLDGIPNNFRLTGLTVNETNHMTICSDVEIRNTFNPADIYINAKIKNAHITPSGIQKIVSNYSHQTVDILKEAERLGTVSIKGNMFGSLNNLNTNIRLNTEAGDMQADILLGKSSLSGKISTQYINMGQLTGNRNFKFARFVINLNSTFNHWKDWKGNIEASLKDLNYESSHYEDIYLSGSFTSNSFNGQLRTNSPDGQVMADGFVLLKGKNSEFDFSASISNMAIDKLCATSKYKNPKLSFTIDTHLKGNHPYNLIGDVLFHNLTFSTETSTYSTDSIRIEATTNESNKQQVILHSDIINGKIEGTYSIKTLSNALKHSISTYLPSLISFEQPFIDKDRENNFQWDLTINNTQELFTALELPVTPHEQLHINGTYSSLHNQFSLNASCPYLNVGKYAIEEGTLNLDNKNGCIELTLNGQTSLLRKNDNKLTLSANIKAVNDSIHSLIHWQSGAEKQLSGKLDFVTNLVLQKTNLMAALVQLNPSELIVNDLVWTISPTSIYYNQNENRTNISHCTIKHDKQAIAINGSTSKNENDILHVSLTKVDLDYIFKSLALEILDFGGVASGDILIKDIFHTRKLSTDLDIDQFAFNSVSMGDLKLHGQWNEEKQGIEMEGKIINNNNSHIDINGFIYPIKEKISVFFDAHNTQIAFLHKYVDEILPNLSGHLTGKLHLFGDLDNPTIEGDAWINNGGFGVQFLNTYYTFNDWIKCTPNEISIKDVTIQDKYGNQALANASVHHNSFKNFRFAVDVSYKNLLILNTTPRINPSFYGNIFATGTLALTGNEELISIETSLHNDEHSLLTLNFMQETNTGNYDFINFIQQPNTVIPSEKSKEFETSRVVTVNTPKTEIRFNLFADIDNEATIEMVMDPVLDNKIKATGNGNLQIQYGTDIPLKIIGKYTIEQGKYNFSLQQAFFRNFELTEGSSVCFYGNPFTADLDVKASYTTSAYIGDLDQQLVQITDNGQRLSTRDNIPVSCILLISGQLKSPIVKFDLELPGATPELEHQIKNYIRTEDMMNRQMLYLLVMGRFYTSPEYTRNETKLNNSLSLLASSTLSSQLSNILGTLSDKFRIGTKFHQTYEGEMRNSTEIELLLSSTLLNNRLTINSNLGYVDNTYLNSTNNIPFIGDCDVEYKLTKKGDIRLKGFNHYNYRNNNPILEMTQGLGILFRKDF